MRTLIFIFVLTTLTLSAQAQSRLHSAKATFVKVEGDGAISDSQFNALVNDVKIKSRAAGVALDISMAHIDGLYPSTGSPFSLESRISELRTYELLARRSGFTHGGRYVHFILPPLDINGRTGIAGIARRVCAGPVNRVSLSNAAPLNSRDESFLNVSRHAAMHEFGHLLGANHFDYLTSLGRASVMHSNALAYVPGDGWLPWAGSSIRDIRCCLKRDGGFC